MASKGPLLLLLISAIALTPTAQALDMNNYWAVKALATADREGMTPAELEVCRNAIFEIVYTHAMLASGKDYDIGSRTGILGKRKKRFATFDGFGDFGGSSYVTNLDDWNSGSSVTNRLFGRSGSKRSNPWFNDNSYSDRGSSSSSRHNFGRGSSGGKGSSSGGYGNNQGSGGGYGKNQGSSGGYGNNQGSSSGGYGNNQGSSGGGYGNNQGSSGGGYGNNQGSGGGYGNNQRSGGGYGNNQGSSGGGYGNNQRSGGGYGNNQGSSGGGYGNNQRSGGGYGNNQGSSGGGYGNNQGSGYGSNQGGGYGSSRRGGYGSNRGGGYGRNQDHHDHRGSGYGGYSRPTYHDPDSHKHFNPLPSKILTCPQQTNQSLVFNLNPTDLNYPATDISNEILVRSLPGSDLFGLCVIAAIVTPGEGPLTIQEPGFVTANSTCPSMNLTLYSYAFQNQVGGRCFILLGFQDTINFRVCETSDCQFCKPNNTATYTHSHHYYGSHDHPSDHRSRNVTQNKCLAEYRSIQVLSYCQNLPLNQRIIYDRVIIPVSCCCNQVDCRLESTDSYHRRRK